MAIAAISPNTIAMANTINQAANVKPARVEYISVLSNAKLLLDLVTITIEATLTPINENIILKINLLNLSMMILTSD